MSARLLQINYKLDIPVDDFREAFGPAAHEIAAVPGLRWKLWVASPGRGEGGGIYLFDDQASVDAYLRGPIVAGIRSHPAFHDLSAKVFEVLEDESAITRGPFEASAPAAGR